jgi:hypothetical protein
VEVILIDLKEPWKALATRLHAERKMDEETIADALRDVENGSHKHLLDTLTT